jgi:hypothetical protein
LGRPSGGPVAGVAGGPPPRGGGGGGAGGGGGGTAGDPVAQEVADAAARARVEVKGPQVGGRT